MLTSKIIQQINPRSDSYTVRYRCFNLLFFKLLLSIFCWCPPTGHWCVSQEDTAVSFCRTLGFEFSPRTPRKRALRDTEMVTKFRFALFDRKLSAIHLELFISGVAPQTPKCRRHLLKKQKHYGIYVVDLSKGNFRNLSVSGALPASRLP